MHLATQWGRLAEAAGRWVTSPSGYVAALLLPVLVLWVADRFVRSRRR